MRHVVLLSCAVLCASGALARDRGVVGAAIAPQLSLSRSSAAAGSVTELTACITNGAEGSRHELAPGDALALSLADGELLACDLAPSATGFGAGPAWRCDVSAREATLVYSGPRRIWEGGELACARLTWRSPTTPTTLRFEARPVVGASMTAGRPAFLPIAIADEPVATGCACAPATSRVASTGPTVLWAVDGGPPVDIEGLDTMLTVREASALLVSVDVPTWDCNGGANLRVPGTFLLMVDGAVVHERILSIDAGVGINDDDHVTFTWLSDALPEGDHRIHAAIVAIPALPCPGCTTSCIADNADTLRTAWMSVIEVPAP
jgi:hypothetical protein